MLRLEIVGKLISEVKFCETIKKRKISLTTLLRPIVKIALETTLSRALRETILFSFIFQRVFDAVKERHNRSRKSRIS